jgi:hypothetical protein
LATGSDRSTGSWGPEVTGRTDLGDRKRQVDRI